MASRTVSVALVADVGAYQSAMVRAASSTKAVGTSAATAGTQAQRGFEAASRGAKLLAGVAAGGLALGLKSAVDAASQAEQSIGGVQAVFKGYARTVIAASEDADQALGLSANSYRELATVIGSQLKNAGVPLDELASKTDGLVTMGADLAAMFGGTTEEAVRALSSALKGEMDPIEAYGISLNDAALKAEAAAMGLEVMGGTLTNSQRAMTVMSLVTKQSADAMGAFGREQDTAAGRAARASAAWENLKVAVGDQLLPVWSTLVDTLGTEVIPAFGEMLEVGGDVAAFIGEHKELALALAAALAIQLAGGIGAVTVAFNRMLLTPAVLGLNAVLGTVLNLPAAFATARAAVAGFIASIAPLAAAGAVVYGIGRLVQQVDTLTNAGEGATAEIDRLRDSVEEAGGGAAGIQAVTASIAELRDRLAETQAVLDQPAAGGDWFTTLIGAGVADQVVRINEATESAGRYRAELDRLIDAQLRGERATSLLSRSFGLTGSEVVSLATKYGIDLNGSVTESRRLFENFYSMEFGAKPTEATIGLEEAMEGAEAAIDEAKQSVDLFKLSLDILTGAHVSMIQVESAFEAALDDGIAAAREMNGVLLDQAGNFDLNNESGRRAANVLLGVRDSGNQLIATMIQQGATAEDVREQDAELRASFIRTAREMGISEAAAQDLADQILGIPAERETKIDADTRAAQDKIRGVQSSIDNLKGRTVEVQVRAAGRFVINPQGGLQEFYEGGYTGPGGKYTPAGIVHAGEFVVPQDRVTALGGPGRVGSLVGMPGYADGGPVLPIGLVHNTRALEQTMEEVANAMRNATPRIPPPGPAGPAGGGSVGGGWSGLWATIRAAFPEARLNSSYRPGDPGWHGRGRAVDLGWSRAPGGIGNAYMASMNRWIHDRYGANSLELIYDGLGDDRPDLYRGRPHTYSASTRAEHRNHVHWAMAGGGVIGEPVAGIGLRSGGSYSFGERGPETVLPGIRSREFGGGSLGGGSAGFKVPAPVVKVYLDGQEWRGMARVEAEGVVDGALTAVADRLHYNGG